MKRPTTAAVIPAYNESENITPVLDALSASPLIDEIVVIDDGSEDDTAEVVRSLRPEARLFSLAYNLGKAGALEEGVLRTEAEVVMFLDADLVGLTQEHIASMIEPVLGGEADGTIGLFVGGKGNTDFAHWVSPGLSGQRVFTRRVLDAMPSFRDQKYAIEVAINQFLEDSQFEILTVSLPGMSQVVKEKKLGPIRGFLARLKMYGQIFKFKLGLDKRKRELMSLRRQLQDAHRKFIHKP